MNNKTNSPSKLSIIIKALVGFGLLIFVCYRAGISEVYSTVLTANWINLMLAVVLVLFTYLLGIKRWQLLARAIGIEASFSHFTVLHFLGLFCNYFLPAGIGGDVVKAHYLSKSEQRRSAYLSVLLDRYVGLLALLLVASIIAFWQPPDDFHNRLCYITWFFFLALIGGGTVSLFFTAKLATLLTPKYAQWAARLDDLTRMTQGFLANYRMGILTLLLSMAAQALSIMAAHQLALAVGATSSVTSMFLVMPLVFLVSVLPISPGGMGTREMAFIYLLSNVGLQQAQSTTVALLWLALNLITSLPGVAGYPLLAKFRTLPLSETS